MEFDFNAVVTFIDRVGWPGAALVIIGYGFRRVCLWLKPYVEAFFISHASLIEELKKSLGLQSDGHRTTHQKLDAIHTDVRDIKEKIDA